MNNPSLQRATLLYQQRRFDLAADALREALAASPNDAYAHAMLGLCLLRQQKYEDATLEAAAAVHHEPDLAFAHYALGLTYLDRNRFVEAERAAREAVRLGPQSASHWTLLGHTFLARSQWTEALDAANHGLEFDPDHNDCINLRAMALVKLGRKAEASQSIAGALGRDPHSAITHANQGWALLHQNQSQQALEHFREALRIDPNNQWAREGTIAALKARYGLYRLMLRYYLWISRFSRRAQWAFVIGIWVGIQALEGIRTSRPELTPFILPFLIGAVVFVVASWAADPLFNLSLLANPFGRHLLNRVQSVGAIAVGALFLGTVILLLLWAITASDIWFGIALLMFAAAFSISATLKCRARLAFRIMAGYSAVVVAAGTAGLLVVPMNPDIGMGLWQYSVWAGVLAGFPANILVNIVPKK